MNVMFTVGLNGRDGHGRLVDGKIVPGDVAISTVCSPPALHFGTWAC